MRTKIPPAKITKNIQKVGLRMILFKFSPENIVISIEWYTKNYSTFIQESKEHFFLFYGLFKGYFSDVSRSCAYFEERGALAMKMAENRLSFG